MTVVKTTCTMDCPDSCALDVQVENGSIRSIRGRTDHPTTGGFICTKIARFDRRVYHDSRIRTALRRTGARGSGTFAPIPVSEAIEEVAHKLGEIASRWGGEAVLPFHYGGSNGLMSEELLDDLFFARLGASRLAKTFCAAPSTAVAEAMYGKMPGVDYRDFPQARCIILWGANPKACQIHLMPFLRQARKNGAFIAVIDPRRNFSEREIDLHLPVLPGTDLQLALAMIHHLHSQDQLDPAFLAAHASGQEAVLAAAAHWSPERAEKVTGVAAQSIRELAGRYAESSPALIRIGWGVERNRNGGQALAAILALPALAGKFGVRAGGYTLSNSGAVAYDRQRALAVPEWQTRRFNMSQLGKVLLEANDPPVKALFVYNANPVITAPNQNAVIRGLEREDLFTVVHEQVMTDTAMYADIVLPATTFLEMWDVKKAYGSYAVGGVQPVIEPVGESLSNIALFARLGRAMGFDDEAFALDEQELMRRVAGSLSLNGAAADAAALRAGETLAVPFATGSGPVQFGDTFPRTPDGKIALSPEILGTTPYSAEDEPEHRFPLVMISPGSERMISSSLGEYNCRELVLTMHPADARERGISSEDSIRVWNDLGEILCSVQLSETIRPGVVAMPKGSWRFAAGNGASATAVIPDHVNRIGGGACYNDARVEVEKVDGGKA